MHANVSSEVYCSSELTHLCHSGSFLYYVQYDPRFSILFSLTTSRLCSSYRRDPLRTKSFVSQLTNM